MRMIAVSRQTLLTLAALIATFHGAIAVMPGEMLADPALEARARQISKDLRCVVCQNQSIDDSNAPLAADLRVLVRERLTKGDSDEQAIGYLVERYGNFVLLKPPLHLNTLILWSGPFLVFAFAALAMCRYLGRQGGQQPDGKQVVLSAREQQRLNEILNRGQPE